MFVKGKFRFICPCGCPFHKNHKKCNGFSKEYFKLNLNYIKSNISPAQPSIISKGLNYIKNKLKRNLNKIKKKNKRNFKLVKNIMKSVMDFISLNYYNMFLFWFYGLLIPIMLLVQYGNCGVGFNNIKSNYNYWYLNNNILQNENNIIISLNNFSNEFIITNYINKFKNRNYDNIIGMRFKDPFLDNNIKKYHRYNKLYKYNNIRNSNNELKNGIFTRECLGDDWFPSKPRYYPCDDVIDKLEEFIETTPDLLDPPKAPEGCHPCNIKYKHELHPRLRATTLPVLDNEPIIKSRKDTIDIIRRKTGRKKSIDGKKYRNSKCNYCKKEGHPTRCCRRRPAIYDTGNPEINDLIKYIKDYPREIWFAEIKNMEDRVYGVIDTWFDIVRRRNKFWSGYGKPNPISDKEYWYLSGRAALDIGYYVAIGATPAECIKIILGNQFTPSRKKPRYRLENDKLINKYNKEVTEVIDEFMDIGAVFPVPHGWARGVTLPIKLVITPKKIRVCLDDEIGTYYLLRQPERYPRIETVGKNIVKGCRVQTGDGMHAFMQIGVTPNTAAYQCFRYHHPKMGDTTFTMVGNYFGHKYSGPVFNDREKIYNRFLRKLGFKFDNYIDDTNIYCIDDPLCVRSQGSFLQRLNVALGRTLRDHKTDFMRGVKKFDFRGYSFNTDTLEVAVKEEKRKNMIKLLRYYNDKKRMRMRTLAKINGKLISTSYAIPSISIICSPIKEQLRINHRIIRDNKLVWKLIFYISDELRESFNYIIYILLNKYSSKISYEWWDYSLFTDASNHIYGIHDERSSIAVIMDKEDRTKSSTFREVKGLYLALLERKNEYSGKVIRATIDNLAVATIVNRNGSKKDYLNDIVFDIIKLINKYDITLITRWMPRWKKPIVYADKISKSVDMDYSLFDIRIIDNIRNWFKLDEFTIDLMATADTRICDRYLSRFEDGKSIAANFLHYKNSNILEWNNEYCYCNPIFRRSFLDFEIQFILSKKLSGVFVFPLWINQHFFGLVSKYSSLLVVIPSSETNWIVSTERSVKWDLVIAVFDNKLKLGLNKLYYYYQLEIIKLDNNSYYSDIISKSFNNKLNKYNIKIKNNNKLYNNIKRYSSNKMSHDRQVSELNNYLLDKKEQFGDEKKEHVRKLDGLPGFNGRLDYKDIHIIKMVLELRRNGKLLVRAAADYAWIIRHRLGSDTIKDIIQRSYPLALTSHHLFLLLLTVDPGTLKTYLYWIFRFLNYIFYKLNNIKTIDDITLEIILNWLFGEAKRGVSPKTINVQMAAIKYLFRYKSLGKELRDGLESKDMLKSINKYFGRRITSKKAFTMDDLVRYNGLIDRNLLIDIRDINCISIMMLTGQRGSDIVNIEWSKVSIDKYKDINGNIIDLIVIQKEFSKTEAAGTSSGTMIGIPRGVGIRISPVESLLIYKKLLIKNNINSPWMFCNLKKPGEHIKPTTTNHIFKKMASKLGYNPKLYGSHSGRKSMVCMAMRRGVPAEVIRKHGKWASDCWYTYFNDSKYIHSAVTTSLLVAKNR